MPRFPGLAIVAALLLALPGLPARAQDRLTVLLDWFVNPDHAALIVAQEKGYFAKAGLAVTLVEPADPSAPPRLVAAGQGDVAVSYQPNLYLQIQEGLPVQRIGTAVTTPLNSLVVLADGPVKQLADLKGKTIGYSIAGFEEALLTTMLASANLTMKDVKLVNVNFALTPALLSGQVDAVIGAFRNFELTELAQAGKPGRAFYPEDHGVPAYDELIFIIHRDRGRDPRMTRFLDAVEAATLYTLNNPKEAWALAVKAYPKLDDALNRQAWQDTLPRLAATPAAVDLRRYERFGRYMVERGLITAVPGADRFTLAP